MNFRHIAGSSAVDIRFTEDGEHFVHCLGSAVVVQALRNPTEQLVLRGHAGAVRCLDRWGDLLATGEAGRDSDVVLWDLRAGRELRRLCEHDGGVLSVSFSPDGLFCASLGADGLVYVLEAASGDIVGRGAAQGLARLAFGPRARDPRGFQLARYHLLALQADGQLAGLVYTPRDGRVARGAPLAAQGRRVAAFCFLPGAGAQFCAVCGSGEVLAGDLARGEVAEVVRAPGRAAALSCCRAFPAAAAAAAAGPAAACVYQTYGAPQPAARVAVGGAGALLVLERAAGGWRVLASHAPDEPAAALDADARGRVLCETARGTAALLAPANGYAPVALQRAQVAPVTAARFMGDGLVALATRDGLLRVLDLADFMPALEIDARGRGGGAHATALQVDNGRVVAGLSDGGVRVYDAESGAELLALPGAGRGAVTALDCLQELVLCGYAGGELRLWDLRAQRVLEESRAHQGRVTQALLQRDRNGRPLSLSAGEDGYLVCQVDGVRLLDFRAPGPARGFAQAGGLFALAAGREALLVDLKGGAVAARAELPERLTALCGAGPGALLAGCADGTVCRLLVEPGALRLAEARRNAHGAAVAVLAARGTTAVSADAAGELIVWD